MGWVRYSLVCSAEVFLRLLRVSDHGLGTGFPVGRADLTVFIGELECLYQAEGFVDAASNGQIIDGHLAEILLSIDDEQSPEWDTALLLQYSVVTGDFHRLVGQQWDTQFAKTSLLARGVDPGQMCKVAVGRDTDHFAVDLLELLNAVREGNDFGRADEGKVQRVEEQHQVLAGIVLQLDFLEGTVDDGSSREFRGGLLELWDGHGDLVG